MAEKRSKQEIIEKGFIEVRIKRGGFFQRHRLMVAKKSTPFGDVYYLKTDREFPAGEMLRIADELDFPVETKGGKYFPKGKSEKSFYGE